MKARRSSRPSRSYLNALEGNGVHVVTVNDYLARRDAEWMGQIYKFLGLTVGLVVPDIDEFERKARRLRGRHHLRDEHRVRLRLPARQHGAEPRPDGPARPPLRDRRRGRLDPHRRGPHAAHHLWAVRRLDAPLLPVREHRPDADARRRLRGRRGKAHSSSRPKTGSPRSSDSSVSRTSTTRWRSTSSTSWARRSRPRSSTTATRTTSSPTAR